MTRHERCQAAIAGRPVDRPPRYIPGIACEAASRILGRKVHTGTGSLSYAEACAWMDGEQAHREYEQRLHEDLADLFRVLDIDVYRIPARMTARPARRVDEHTFVYGDPEGAHSIWRYCPESGDFGVIDSRGPDPADPAAFEQAVAAQERAIEGGQLRDVRLAGDYLEVCRRFADKFFVVYNAGGIGVGLSQDRLLLLALAPEAMRREILVQAAHTVAAGRALAQTPYPLVMIGGMDLAGNDGPMYSPETFRHVTLPGYQRAMDELRPLGVHLVFRSDGKLWPVSDMLFTEAGIGGYGEVDREVGMTMAAVRQRYPRLVVWGNFSSSFLVRSSAAEVRDEAQRIVAESGGTGYFHGCSNAILQGTPVENVLALFGA